MTGILVVDDDREILEIITDTFIAFGYTITSAINGLQALEMYKNSSFDLAIVDVDMPEMNGLDLTREIKKLEKDFPVILMTGFSHLYKAHEVLNLDIEAFLQKPLNLPDLVKLAEKILTQRKSW